MPCRVSCEMFEDRQRREQKRPLLGSVTIQRLVTTLANREDLVCALVDRLCGLVVEFLATERRSIVLPVR
jgi:hypothetical protein